MGLDKEKIKRLHAMAARNGLIVSGDRSDLLALVYGQTGKEHVSELTDREFTEVYRKILTMGKSNVPGMMPKEQIRKAWALMYRLCEMDPREGVSVRARMAGAIKSILKVDAPKYGDLFRWIPAASGNKLIEGLKRYRDSAGRRQGKKEGSPTGLPGGEKEQHRSGGALAQPKRVSGGRCDASG